MKMRMAYMIAAGVSALIWAILLNVRTAKCERLVQRVRKGFVIPGVGNLIYVGLNLVCLFKMDGSSRRGKKLKNAIVVKRGGKYIDYHYKVLRSWQLFLVATAIPIMFYMMAILPDVTVAFIVPVFTGVICWIIEANEELDASRKGECILKEFSSVVSKLTLLVGSGMILSKAWEKIAYDGVSERDKCINSLKGRGKNKKRKDIENKYAIYELMKEVCENIENGMLEDEAIEEFGKRCGFGVIQKFATAIVQTKEKGDGSLTEFLNKMTNDMWTERKDNARKKGDKANEAMLIPAGIIVIVVLIMTIAPSFVQMIETFQM